MRRRKSRRAPVNHERWLVSYADFITLLFAFFVVLFSSSQVDKRKMGRLAQEMQSVFNAASADIALPGGTSLLFDDRAISAAPPIDLSRIADTQSLQSELETALKTQIADKNITVKPRHDGLVISFRDTAVFDSGDAAIKPSAVRALESIAETLATRPNPLRIEGHTDDRPIHTARFESNWELSTARATELVKYFVMSRHFPPAQLSAAGYAEYHPVSSNDTSEGRAANRRVDIVVVGAGASH